MNNTKMISRFSLFKRMVLFAIIMSMLCTMLSACSSSGDDEDTATVGENGVVYVYNYGDYVDPDVVDMFEEETGIKVIYDTFDTNEEMYPIISSSSVKYDVVGAGDYMVEKMIQNDLLSEINHDNVPNFKYVSEMCLEFAEGYDPGNVYSMPYTWGTVGILYNSRNIPDGEITLWSDLWKDKYYDDIMMMDSLRDGFMIPLKILGCSCNTSNEDEISKAADKLIEQKELVYKYATDAIRDLLLNESANIGVIYSGEAIYCQEDDEDMHYVLPEEGSNIWFDTWTIPKVAENKENAEKWINFMYRPDIALKTYEYLHYGTPNVEAEKMIAELYPEDFENPALFPDESLIAKCETYHYLGKETDAMYNKYWKKFKAS